MSVFERITVAGLTIAGVGGRVEGGEPVEGGAEGGRALEPVTLVAGRKAALNYNESHNDA